MIRRLNLIPVALQTERSRRRRLRGWCVVIGVASAAAAVPAAAQWLQTRRLDELRATHQQIESDLAATRAELKSLAAEANELFLRLERAKALRAKRSWSGMFSLLAETLPAGCWLNSLATDPDVPPPQQAVAKVLPPTAAAPPAATAEKPTPVNIEAPRRLRILGQSVEASGPLAFVLQLKNAGVFRDVVLEHSQREVSDTEATFRFEVVCTW